VICCLCPKTAWYQVSRLGFCGDHRAEAYQANADRRARKLGSSKRVNVQSFGLSPMAQKKKDSQRYTL
jgi:hypothetical protein